MKKFLILILIFLNTSLFSKELKKVSLQLSWFDQFQFAGYYMAKEKGFYEKLGLDVEIKPFSFGVNVPDDIDNKKSDFGIGRETLILDRASGKKIVALYALFQATPLVLLAKNESNINSIKDFKNKIKDIRSFDKERFANINASLAKELARSKAVKRWKRIKSLNNK